MNKKKKILFTASIMAHFRAFHLPYFKWFKENGFEVHAAAKWTGESEKELTFCDKTIEIAFERSPYSIKNIKAYKQLKQLIKEGDYDIIHCHTPMASIITRLASSEARKKGTKILYTAHGFHFYKGASLINWILYFPMEKLFSKFADVIITINQEDFNAIKDYNFKCSHSFKVPGVGVNTERLLVPSKEIKESIRNEYGYQLNEYILIYIAELIERKNHKFIIDSISILENDIPNIKVIFVGDGKLLNKLQKYAIEKKVDSKIDFLGYRKDVGKLIALSDVGISTSLQEGLGLNVAEYMFGGLPVIVSEDRGHFEMVIHGRNGYLYPQNDIQKFLQYIKELKENIDLRKRMGEEARESIQRFSIENALKEHIKIYKNVCNI